MRPGPHAHALHTLHRGCGWSPFSAVGHLFHNGRNGREQRCTKQEAPPGGYKRQTMISQILPPPLVELSVTANQDHVRQWSVGFGTVRW